MGLKHAKALRKQMTDAERRLWYRLRAHRFGGYTFKRQVPIGPYVVDFACLGHKLVLESDGGQHADSSRDEIRDEWLRQNGFRILLFWNNDVLRQTNAVLEQVLQALEQAETSSPSPGALRAPPSPLRGEGKGARGTDTLQ